MHYLILLTAKNKCNKVWNQKVNKIGGKSWTFAFATIFNKMAEKVERLCLHRNGTLKTMFLGGWVDGWQEVKAVLRNSYSNQKN